ncbi:Rho termination factor N-terminal domain-containing protein [Cyanobium sp. WAJ14-Wanaka]|uniref:Rho termination factor N-terminal domain-containing protein n=1 Tax=Cyanobium sp. WAJ14-Wanaka TaxID=2823725 RepID=UPI0020CD9540|nr:Rho termination factor N-terminal domain-containing protein [Cyanobium sp. WAJ14-Wanaka]MCP9775111.1 Rho termination factor N-terminal domain-containing protein [Cyanobium sp. WAJ14-Wanaka]
MAKKLLSDQFREQLQSLGSSLGAHTRSLEQHFENQEAFLALRHRDLEETSTASLPAAQSAEAALEAALAPIVKGDLALLPVTELKRLCSRTGLKGYSKYKKQELISLLKAIGVTAPPLQVKKLTRSQLEAIANAVLATRG